MKNFRRILCTLLAVVMLAGMSMVTAGAAGTVACGTATVTASVLNIRSGAGTDKSIAGTVNNGSTVVVLEKTSDSWYKINYNGTTGYVSTDYLADFSTVDSLNVTGKVNATEVRWRSEASTSGDVLGVIDSGTKVSVIGIRDGWYKLSYNGSTGYMRSDYIDIIGAGSASSSSSSSEAKSGTVNEDYVNFRTGPSTDYSVIRMLPYGTTVSVLDSSADWYHISYSGTEGYMLGDFITIAGSSSSSSSSSSTASEESMDETGKVSGSYVNFRSGPSTNYSVVATLAKGTKVEIIGKTSGWYKIRYDGATGYMCADYVSIVDESAAEETTETASSSNASLGEQIAQYAQQFVGYSYVYGGASPSSGFDCSGLMYYVYGQFGYKIARPADDQYACNGTYVSKSDLQPGDLVFFSSDGFASITHVGMYIGNNKFVHASGSTVGVIISDLTSSYYLSVYYGAKRIV